MKVLLNVKMVRLSVNVYPCNKVLLVKMTYVTSLKPVLNHVLSAQKVTFRMSRPRTARTKLGIRWHRKRTI